MGVVRGRPIERCCDNHCMCIYKGKVGEECTEESRGRWRNCPSIHVPVTSTCDSKGGGELSVRYFSLFDRECTGLRQTGNFPRPPVPKHKIVRTNFTANNECYNHKSSAYNSKAKCFEKPSGDAGAVRNSR